MSATSCPNHQEQVLAVGLSPPALSLLEEKRPDPGAASDGSREAGKAAVLGFCPGSGKQEGVVHAPDPELLLKALALRGPGRGGLGFSPTGPSHCAPCPPQGFSDPVR